MASSLPQEEPAVRRGKILLVQRPGQAMDLFHSLLTHEGYETAEADSCKAGVRLLDADRHIECIIADLRMACGGSFDLVKAVKNSPRLRQIPVLLTTAGNPDRQMVLQAIETGASGVVILPTDRQKLLEKIATAIRAGRPRILVVDDDDMIRDLLVNVLEIERFAVSTAASANEALTLLNKITVSAVITDMLMPGMSGMELLKKLRVDQPELPVLLITGYSGHHTPRDILQAGAAGYFTKPFKNTELVKVLRQALERGGQPPAEPSTSVAGKAETD